jgi:hypothetical protein
MRPLASRPCRFPAAGLSLLFLMLSLTPCPARTQTQQPFLFAGQSSSTGQLTSFAVFVRNDQTGDLAEVFGSPFTNIHSLTCGMSLIDPLGRFAYGTCDLGASMYSLNGTTGAVAEVTGSPSSASTDTGSGALAAEATGQFVYLLKFSLDDSYPTNSSVLLDTFQQDSTDEQLVPQSSQSITLIGTHPGESGPRRPYPVAMLYTIPFDPVTSLASEPAPLLQTGNNGITVVIDGPAKNLVISSGQNCGTLWFPQLAPTNGTMTGNTTADLACEEFAQNLTFDPTSTFCMLISPERTSNRARAFLLSPRSQKPFTLRFPRALRPKLAANLIRKALSAFSRTSLQAGAPPFMASIPPQATLSLQLPSPIRFSPAERSKSGPPPSTSTPSPWKFPWSL